MVQTVKMCQQEVCRKVQKETALAIDKFCRNI